MRGAMVGMASWEVEEVVLEVVAVQGGGKMEEVTGIAEVEGAGALAGRVGRGMVVAVVAELAVMAEVGGA